MLVREAYVRLIDVDQPQQWNGRRHFLRAAAEAMRRIVVEKARQKRGGVIEHTAVDEIPEVSTARTRNLLALGEALNEFERQSPEKAKLVKLRYFAGFTTLEAVQALEISVRTAELIWTYAKAWLLQAIEGDD